MLQFLISPSSSLVSLLLVGKQTDTQACKIFRFPSHLWLMNVCSICRFCSKTTACSRFIRYCRQASQSQRRMCCIKVCFCAQTNQEKNFNEFVYSTLHMSKSSHGQHNNIISSADTQRQFKVAWQKKLNLKVPLSTEYN